MTKAPTSKSSNKSRMQGQQLCNGFNNLSKKGYRPDFSMEYSGVLWLMRIADPLEGSAGPLFSATIASASGSPPIR
jgi:hypothetical protein